MFKACNCIDLKIYIQLYKLTYNHDIIVIWKGKTYKHVAWLYRFLDKVHITDSKRGNTYHKYCTEYNHVDWQKFTNNFSNV